MDEQLSWRYSLKRVRKECELNFCDDVLLFRMAMKWLCLAAAPASFWGTAAALPRPAILSAASVQGSYTSIRCVSLADCCSDFPSGSSIQRPAIKVHLYHPVKTAAGSLGPPQHVSINSLEYIYMKNHLREPPSYAANSQRPQRFADVSRVFISAQAVTSLPGFLITQGVTDCGLGF